MASTNSEELKKARARLAAASAAAKSNAGADSTEVREDHATVFDAISELKTEDIDPWLGRTIKVLIRKSPRHIVYLDQEHEVQWWWAAKPDNVAVISEVQAEVTRLSMDCSYLLRPEFATPWLRLGRGNSAADALKAATDRLIEIRSLLAEAIAHALDASDLSGCRKILAEAERQILLEKDRRCRPMFIEYFFAFSLFLASLTILLCELNEADLLSVADQLLQLLRAGTAGTFGALISAVLRSTQLALEPRSERAGIRTDALARAIVGFGAGVLTGLCVDAGLFNAVKDSSLESVRMFLTICAGASERILPTLLSRAEAMTGEAKSKGK